MRMKGYTYNDETRRLHPESQSAPAPNGDAWKCPKCGKEGIVSNFCPDCGERKPEKLLWKCPRCGKEGITSRFCPDCGEPMPVTWDCPDCGTKGIESNFCPNCGRKKQ